MSSQKHKRPIKSLQPLQTTQFSYAAHPIYAWGTVCLVWIASLLPWRTWSGSPDLVLLVLAFWCAHRVRGMGMLAGFLLGILMDVHDTSLLGQHALTYVLVLFGATVLSKRMMQFDVVGQFVHMLPIFLLAPIPSHLLAVWLVGVWTGWTWLWSGLITAVLWFAADLVLRLPVAPSSDDDATL